MNTSFLPKLIVAVCLSSALSGFGADSAVTPKKSSAATPEKVASPAQQQLQEVVQKIQAKLRDGKKTEADLADELKQFDGLLKEHAGEKTDDVAQILFMKAMLYVQIFDDTDKGSAILKQLQKDFPDTKQAKQVDTMLAGFEKQAAAKQIQKSLAVGAKFPEFNEKDVLGAPMSIGKYQGKVVLVDFWATWCGPCVKELPNVLATYEKFHGKGFEIVGISLDQSAQKLNDFTKEHKMTWQQFFDGKGWGNKLAGVYGVTSIPATYLLDGTGKIIGKDLRGDELEQAVAAALAKK